MPEITIKFPILHSGQRPIYDRLGQRNILVCGRRFGKSRLLETRAAKRALQGRLQGWFTPDYKLMRPSYQRLYQMLQPAISHSSKTESIIELKTKGSIEFWTLDNDDAGRSRAYHDVTIDEASLVKKGLKEIVEQAISPTLLDYNGSLTMAGTPKGIDPENFFYVASTQLDTKFSPERPFGWREFHLPTAMNPLLNRDSVAELQTKYPPLVYQQEYLAEFVDWSGTAFFAKDRLLVGGRGVPYPPSCDTVFAVIDSATKTGRENDGTAALFCAYSEISFGTWPLVILDWDLVQIEGALLEMWLPQVIARGRELAAQCRARLGFSGVFIEDKNSGSILLQQGLNRQMPVIAIDSKLTSYGKSERAINISGYVFQEKVKLSEYAHDKVVNYKGITQNHLLTQVVGFRVGLKDQVDDDLLDTFCYAPALALGNSEGY